VLPLLRPFVHAVVWEGNSVYFLVAWIFLIEISVLDDSRRRALNRKGFKPKERKTPAEAVSLGAERFFSAVCLAAGAAPKGFYD